jgi:hypothetical protein
MVKLCGKRKEVLFLHKKRGFGVFL